MVKLDNNRISMTRFNLKVMERTCLARIGNFGETAASQMQDDFVFRPYYKSQNEWVGSRHGSSWVI